MKNINKKDNNINTIRKTVVFFTAILFVTSSVITIENVGSAKDNELEKKLSFIESGGENWWNSSFDYRKLITINHSQVNEDLTNFPILIYRFKDVDLNSHAQADGDDICFVLYTDNSTKLNHEIESYGVGTGWIWVNVTSLSSSTDTKLWLYYGNATCGSQENIAGTWDSNYVMVHHLNESDSTGLNHFKDSTYYNNDGTLTDADGDTNSVVGKIGNAIDFSVDNDYILIQDSHELDIQNDITLEAWVNRESLANWDCITFKCDPNDQKPMNWQFGSGQAPDYGSNKALVLDYSKDDGDEWNTHWVDNVFGTGVWQWIAVTYDGFNVRFYEYGGKLDTQAETDKMDTHNYDVYIGSLPSGNGLNGIIDELRISKTTRNDSWLGATFNTTSNPSTFLSVGSEEASNKPPHMPSNPYPAHGSTSVNVNVDLSWTGGDPNGDPVTYDVYLGTNSTPPKVASNQTSTSYDPGTLELDKTYYWKIIAWDNQSAFTEGPVWWFSTGTNQPPSKPIILSAPSFGRSEIQLDFSAVAMDPEGDQIYYMWDWGDGGFSGWLGPFVSGQTAEAHHTWDESGEYEIKVKAKDYNDAESYWSDSVQLIIENIPPNIVINKPLPNILYFGNQPLFPFLVTLIIGSIDIEVNASDNLSGMDKVEFYIKDVLKKTVTSAPYIWLWGGITFGLKLCDIKVIAYDKAGNNAYDTIIVWRFL